MIPWSADFICRGSPIRTSPDQFLFANPRSFSQLTTSFFAFGSLGILRSLLFSFSSCESHFDDFIQRLVFYSFAYEIAALTTRKNFDSYQTIISFYLVISLSIVNELCLLFPSLSEGDAKVHIFFYPPNFFKLFFKIFTILVYQWEDA